MTIPNQPPFGQRYQPPYTEPQPRGVRERLRRIRESSMFPVAASAVAGAVAAYYGTTRAVRGHTVDIYFKVSDELDAIAEAGKTKEKKSKKSKKKD